MNELLNETKNMIVPCAVLTDYMSKCDEKIETLQIQLQVNQDYQNWTVAKSIKFEIFQVKRDKAVLQHCMDYAQNI